MTGIIAPPLKVEIRNVYGNETVYPKCDQSRLFCDLLNTKTLTPRHIGIISRMGYQFEVATEMIPRVLWPTTGMGSR